MEVRLVSTLTPDDEERLAPLLMDMMIALLDSAGLAYKVHIRTSTETVFEHWQPAVSDDRASRSYPPPSRPS